MVVDSPGMTVDLARSDKSRKGALHISESLGLELAFYLEEDADRFVDLSERRRVSKVKGAVRQPASQVNYLVFVLSQSSSSGRQTNVEIV